MIRHTMITYYLILQNRDVKVPSCLQKSFLFSLFFFLMKEGYHVVGKKIEFVGLEFVCHFQGFSC